MNYEQKYKEALERARNMHEQDMSAERLEYIFPELRESEDEEIRKALIDYFDDANKVDENPLQSYGIHTDKAIAWLEKQGNQPSWSEEDEKFLSYAISLTDDAQIKNFLESLKDRVQPKSKQEWSKEDELTIERIVDTIEIARSLKNGKPKALYTDEILDGLIDWLKSLKPQPHWKPSEEQMKAIKFCCANFEEYDALKSLYNVLKTLI